MKTAKSSGGGVMAIRIVSIGNGLYARTRTQRSLLEQ
jgi:hypothetical protein